MTALCKQLLHAYREEERLYGQVKDLVAKQAQIMETHPDPQGVLGLCAQVEGLMADIATVEQAIEPAKKQWEQEKSDPHGELDAVLSSIENAIQDTARMQEQVQQRLLEYMARQKQLTETARATMNTQRARRLYRAG